MLICAVDVCFKDLGLHTLSGHSLLSLVRTCIKSLGYDGKLALNPICIRETITIIFANSEDPDEMQHNAAFHQSQHLLYTV